MRQSAILVPVFALAAWTGLMLVLTAARRLTAGAHPREFALGESPRVPAKASLPNRNYMNLLELPVLFYVICIVAYASQAACDDALPLAWCYVGLRMVHSVIHVTYNNVLHRFAAFGLSNLALLALWVTVGLALFSGHRAA